MKMKILSCLIVSSIVGASSPLLGEDMSVSYVPLLPNVLTLGSLT